MSLDEEKYDKLRQSLRNLPKIKAKDDFEARLHRRIAEHQSLHDKVFKPQEGAKRDSWVDMLANLFRPSLAPAIGLAVVLLAVIVVYFAYYNELSNDKQQLLESSSSDEQKKDELVIYVREDGERVHNESARDIVSAEDFTQPTTMYSPTEVSTDAYARPEEQPVPGEVTDEKDKRDIIGPEQKLEMEKEYESKTGERKIETKGEDGIMMKKSGKTDTKDAPFNIRKEDTGDETEGYINKQDSNEEMNQQTDEINKDDDKERLARSRKDSLRAKEKELDEQKDSIEK